jgi:hypothetical protein
LGERPFRELVKLPRPDPSLVFVDRSMDGLPDVLQQIPRTVTGAPPSAVTVPPELIEVVVILDAAVVSIPGGTGGLHPCKKNNSREMRTAGK